MKKRIVFCTLAGAAAVVLLLCGLRVLPPLFPSDGELYQQVTDSAVTASDLQDEDGNFIILDYPGTADYVTSLGDYASLTVEAVPKADVTQEQVQDGVEQYVSYYGRYDQTTKGVTKEGDLVTISYTGYQDGLAVGAYTVQDGLFLLGSDSLPSSFSESLIGVSIGEEQSFSVSFPEDWGDAYAGKTLSFRAVVSAVNTIPAVTDETASRLSGGEYATADAFLSYIRETIASYQESQYETALSDEIMTKLLETSTFGTPSKESIAWYVSLQMQPYQIAAAQRGMTMDDYLSSAGLGSSEDLVKRILQDAPDALRPYALLDAVAQAEGIDVDETADKDYLDSRRDQLVDSYGLYDVSLVPDYYKTSNLYRDVRAWKAFDFLMAHVIQN